MTAPQFKPTRALEFVEAQEAYFDANAERVRLGKEVEHLRDVRDAIPRPDCLPIGMSGEQAFALGFRAGQQCAPQPDASGVALTVRNLDFGDWETLFAVWASMQPAEGTQRINAKLRELLNTTPTPPARAFVSNEEMLKELAVMWYDGNERLVDDEDIDGMRKIIARVLEMAGAQEVRGWHELTRNEWNSLQRVWRENPYEQNDNDIRAINKCLRSIFGTPHPARLTDGGWFSVNGTSMQIRLNAKRPDLFDVKFRDREIIERNCASQVLNHLMSSGEENDAVKAMYAALGGGGE